MIIEQGNPFLLGCTKQNRSYNFAIEKAAEEITLLIFDSNQTTVLYEIVLNETYKTGNVFACRIAEKGLDRCYYVYRCGKEFYTDPYAKTVTHCENFGEMAQAPFLSRIALEAFDWKGDAPLHIPYEDTILYKMNVRGFTKSCTSHVAHKGTFKGIAEKADYLRKLGITSLELMPAYEFDECNKFPQYRKERIYGGYIDEPSIGKVNYWGYTKGFHFAPKASFCSIAHTKSDYTIEYKKMIRTMHKYGIEVLMEMYFTTESVAFILDCVRYWVRSYHIDGVHLYASAAACEAVATDAVLSDTKIFVEHWEGERGTVKHMANYETGFLKTARRFLKGEENLLGTFVDVVKANPKQSANVNYITNHNGFTLYYLVSYERKHNENNGENNMDGENFNDSWNCGAEGKTRKKKVLELRRRQMKNAFMLLLLSQGTPLILAGDEFKNTQNGNNNPYCIDSETSWLNWKKSEDAADMIQFVRKLIAFRKEHKILHMSEQLYASDRLSCGYPDISYHGSSAWYNAMENYNRHIGILYCTQYAGVPDEEDLLYVVYNMHWEAHELALPKTAENSQWTVKITSGDAKKDVVWKAKKSVCLAPRTVAVLGCKKEKIKKQEPLKE